MKLEHIKPKVLLLVYVYPSYGNKIIFFKKMLNQNIEKQSDRLKHFHVNNLISLEQGKQAVLHRQKHVIKECHQNMLSCVPCTLIALVNCKSKAK